MRAIRQILISMVAFAAVPAAFLQGASDTVQFIGGSSKAIPVNSTGTFAFGDAKELQFNYGQSVYKLPYSQITGTDVIHGETRHFLKKIPVPSMPGHRKETLSVSYKDPSGLTGTLNFELTENQANWAREAIAAKTAKPASQAASNQTQDWWGDRYWKTNRNKAAWEGTSQTTQPGQPATSTPSGTKE